MDISASIIVNDCTQSARNRLSWPTHSTIGVSVYVRRLNRARRVKDPEAVAAIVSTLRQVHGDSIARAFLANGVSLAVLVDAVLSLPVRNDVAARIIARALESRDFGVSPAIGPLWHVKYLYDRPGSMTVVDLVVLTPDRAFSSTELTLRLLV